MSPAQRGAAHSDGLPLGTRLGEFELTGHVGVGGFSTVYLAWDHSLDRRVAIKEYLPESLARRVDGGRVEPRTAGSRDTFELGLRSFINEAKALARFDHPALVKVYRFWEANGTAYMVMPFYEGRTVKEVVRERGRPPDEAWLMELLEPLTTTLAVLHAEQWFHRDIAPDNIILLADSGKPLLLDFGAARRVIADQTQALTVILKPGYAPLEQYAEIAGMDQGAWTDVYALAATLYWAITGATPPSSISRLVRDDFKPAFGVCRGRYSDRFLLAVDAALALKPEDRTPSIAHFRAALGLAHGPLATQPLPLPVADPQATVIRVPRTHPQPPTPTPTLYGSGRADEATAGSERSAPAPVPVSAAAAPSPDRAEPPGTAAGIRDERPDRPRKWIRPGAALLALAVAASIGVWWLRPAATPPVVSDIAAPVVLPPPATPETSTASSATAAIPPAGPGAGAGRSTEPPTSAPSSAANSAANSPAPSEPEPTVRPAVAAADKPAQPASTQRPAATAARKPGSQTECAAILQRLSLGESSAELMERLQQLKC